MPLGVIQIHNEYVVNDTCKTMLVWGYNYIAQHGLDSLIIDAMAKETGKSRSSFYHCFGDIEEFERELFKYHMKQTKAFSEAAESIDNLIPEGANLIVDFKNWVFFHRQMFLLQNDDRKYKEMYNQTRSITEEKTLELWMKTAGLNHLPKDDVEKFFFTLRAAALSRFRYDNFSVEVLINEISILNKSFKFLLDQNKPDS